MQYYVTGRFGAHERLAPVCGNLLHHAVEMFLKGFLVKTHSLRELAKKPFCHDLNHAWSVFKSQIADSALEEFDDTVATLHAFDHIRYPDKIIAEGGTLSISWDATQVAVTPSGPYAAVPSYRLNISKLDKLIRTVFDRCSINPMFFISGMSLEAQKYLSVKNDHFKGWLV
jgi:hypothetical protein